MMARPMGRPESLPSRCTMRCQPWARTTWRRITPVGVAMPFGGRWSVAWFWAAWAPGKWFRRRRGSHGEAMYANGAVAFGRARWAVQGSSRSDRAPFCNLFLMSPLSASTTVGSRTALSSTSGWSLQHHSGMCLWRWNPILSTAFASVFPMAWATSVMQSGRWSLRPQRRQALRASTTLRTSTSRDDRIPLVATILICQVLLCTTASFAVGVPKTWANSHQSVGTHGLVPGSSGDRPRCAFAGKRAA